MKIFLIALLIIIGFFMIRNSMKQVLGKADTPEDIMRKLHSPYITDETAFYIVKMLATLITLVTYLAILISLLILAHSGVNETTSITITVLVIVIMIDTISGWIPMIKYKEPEEYFTKVLTGWRVKVNIVQNILFGSIYIAVAIVFIFTL